MLGGDLGDAAVDVGLLANAIDDRGVFLFNADALRTAANVPSFEDQLLFNLDDDFAFGTSGFNIAKASLVCANGKTRSTMGRMVPASMSEVISRS